MTLHRLYWMPGDFSQYNLIIFQPVWAPEVAPGPVEGHAHTLIDVLVFSWRFIGLTNSSVQIACTSPEGLPPVQEAHWLLLALSTQQCGQSDNWTKHGSISFWALFSEIMSWSTCCPLSESRCFVCFIYCFSYFGQEDKSLSGSC